MAQAVSRRVFAQSTSGREVIGMGLIVLGVLGILGSAG
jgi:multidrug transporter EmrE-like cation transporter